MAIEGGVHIPIQVFCIKCKHYEKQPMDYEKCLHHDNSSPKVRKVNHRTEYFIQTGHLQPHELNANNNCKWYTPKKVIKVDKWSKKPSKFKIKPPLFTLIMVIIVWLLLNI